MRFQGCFCLFQCQKDKDTLLTNHELSKMVETSDEWITTRVGIKERPILKGENKGTSDMARMAMNTLLEKSDL